MAQSNQPSWQGNAVLAQTPAGTARRSLVVGNRLGAGGEGVVYQDASRPDYVLKIMRTPTADSEAKTWAMLNAPPAEQVGQYQGADLVQIAWPQELLTDQQGHYIGFSMRYLDMSLTVGLGAWTNPRERKLNNLSSDDRLRVHLAANLASVTDYVNQAGHALIDLKPLNVLAYRKDGYVCLVDCDGFRIQSNGRVFPAGAFTPNYLAPEYQAPGIAAAQLGEEQDRFALAVVIYELLDNGIHPFSGIDQRNPGSSYVLTGRIQDQRTFLDPSSGLAPHKSSHCPYFADETLNLFLAAFLGGPGQRPSAAEWKAHLQDLARYRLQQCHSNPDHWHYGKGCPWCRSNPVQMAPPQAASGPRISTHVSSSGAPSPQLPRFAFPVGPASAPPLASAGGPAASASPYASPSYGVAPPAPPGSIAAAVYGPPAQLYNPNLPAASYGPPGSVAAASAPVATAPAARRWSGKAKALCATGLALAAILLFIVNRPADAFVSRRDRLTALSQEAAVVRANADSVQSAGLLPALGPPLATLEQNLDHSLSNARTAIEVRNLEATDQSLIRAGDAIQSLRAFLANLPAPGGGGPRPRPAPPNPPNPQDPQRAALEQSIADARGRLERDGGSLAALAARGAQIPAAVGGARDVAAAQIDSAADAVGRADYPQAQSRLALAAQALDALEAQLPGITIPDPRRGGDADIGTRKDIPDTGGGGRGGTGPDLNGGGGRQSPPPVPAVSPAVADRLDKLGIRAAVIERALGPLKAAQAAAGYGLRNDMAAAEMLMHNALGRAAAAINGGREADSLQQMDQAERAIEQLEQFLNI